MASSVQQDLSEFLLSGQQDLLTTVGTTTTTNSSEIEQNEVFNLPVTTSNHPNTTNTTIVGGDHQTDFQELALHNLDNLDSLLVNNR